jgi:hypothetical protein
MPRICISEQENNPDIDFQVNIFVVTTGKSSRLCEISGSRSSDYQYNSIVEYWETTWHISQKAFLFLVDFVLYNVKIVNACFSTATDIFGHLGSQN